ncbi:putative Elicitor-responsive protein [Toxoplasma gondii RUB]|uniref:Putative Elicitor-responsive protein n=2 Tax=Toxoplasma gondii TaxID=5811 RepID=A0A086LZ71_TOXGO|nr:putative Elicitor-responsive protein [Toxoplasma gondii RUB]RQX73267.1 putative Elicitor-responsive protein [Toxoplasma gondii CAST]
MRRCLSFCRRETRWIKTHGISSIFVVSVHSAVLTVVTLRKVSGCLLAGGFAVSEKIRKMSDPNQPTHVTVTVHGARELHSTNLITKMDPYCIVTMGNHTFKTNVDDHGNKTPCWNQAFKMDYVGEAQMRFKVLDKDKLTKDDYIGMADVTLSPIVYGTRLYNAEIELTRKEGKHAGFLKITIEFEPKIKAGTSSPSAAPLNAIPAAMPAPATVMHGTPAPAYTAGYVPAPLPAGQPMVGTPYYPPLPVAYAAPVPGYAATPAAGYAPQPAGYGVPPSAAAYQPPGVYGQPPSPYYGYPPGSYYPFR